MHIPLYWAEGRAQSRARGKQVTARRFGWSDSSQSEAQAHADERAQGALQAILAGKQLKRREAKVAYNGFDGLPIREEILQRDQETVLTRNAYGAHCLNTPNVLFADVDFTDTTPLLYSIFIYILLIGGWFYSFINLGYHWLWALILAIPVVAHYFALLCKFLFSLIYGKDEDLLRYRIINFLKQHPEWNFHLYQTPAGMRILATHRTFDQLEPNYALIPSMNSCVKNKNAFGRELLESHGEWESKSTCALSLAFGQFIQTVWSCEMRGSNDMKLAQKISPRVAISIHLAPVSSIPMSEM
jgi:hypothetical protein